MIASLALRILGESRQRPLADICNEDLEKRAHRRNETAGTYHERETDYDAIQL